MMTDDIVLIASYALIGPAWLALMFVPQHRFTEHLCRTAWLSLVLAGLYFVLVLLNIGHGSGGIWSMAQLTELFSHRRVVLIGWVHYLSFDLFVGYWVARDGVEQGLSKWLVAPCLFFVLIMGPIGLLMYFGLRMATRRSWSVYSRP